ncbi:MAG: HD-GYP domain-containing protein [Alicycliphilus sp.]|jgi:HD-GYP domain-containing protein (c-di-GMP phosphodiesterase class II)|nr:HD-GYP domain-containing protein [Alicycliphilus sp.]MBP7324316.1 HD-GYP domain-containing protein [Alicycliphilus sp.]MBP7328717.1 HD-GYP domain-containing protein [Alicycliphilus sp.]TXJ08502.1 MAG: HD-GYP domain-containing protein [Alicycliphilus sp.]
MLKRIHVQQLSLGMYLHELCGSWMEHPFWRTRFLLEDPQDLLRIRETSIQEVLIDISKGLDLANAATAQAEGEVSEAPQASPVQAEPVQAEPPSAATPMAQELQRAASICANAKQAVISMFSEARMGRAVDASSAPGLVSEIADSVTRNPSALISLARIKTADEYTFMHSVAVCALMVGLARQMGLNDEATQQAGLAGLLHDLGKAHIPLEILNKPGKLSDAEFALMRGHPGAGHALLQGQGLPAPVLDACLHHHEKIDGTGYPHRLPAEQITTLARMAAICDVYDAITSDRPYKAGWDPAESLRRMAEWTRDHLDQRLYQAFVKSLGIYPVGSLVRLTSGRLGVVTEQSPGTLLTPRVKVFYSTKSDMRIPPELIDLSAPGCREQIAGREDPARWQFPDLNELWSGLPHQPW